MITPTILVSLLLLATLTSLTATRLEQGQGLVFEAVPTQLESPLDTAEVKLHNSLVC